MAYDSTKTSDDDCHCTVVIVNWNSWDILPRCLEKLECQTFQNFNVLVIDNASDQPVPVGLLSKHHRVTLIQNKTNLGFAAANNQAIRLLDDTEWLVLLNPDAFPEPGWLEKLVRTAEQNPAYSAFGSRQMMENNKISLMATAMFTTSAVWFGATDMASI